MIIHAAVRPVACFITLLSALTAAAPAWAECAPQARLVHCGASTCLRLSGHRPSAKLAVRIAGQDLPVAGNRNWAITVPLQTGREWQRSFGDTLTVAYVDPATKSERTQDVMLPPGALGRHVELVSLLVSAH